MTWTAESMRQRDDFLRVFFPEEYEHALLLQFYRNLIKLEILIIVNFNEAKTKLSLMTIH